MRMTCGWTGPRLAAVALAIGLLATSGQAARAAAMTSEVEYSTTGTVISSSGVTGSNVISFNSVAGGSFLSPSSFSLGEFLVASLQVGQTTSYANTPFEITYIAKKVNGSELTVNDTPIKLTGVLNGKISGPNQSSVVATFDPLPTSEFRTGDFLNTLTLSGSVLLVPSSNNGGRTTAQGQLTSTYAPPPPAVPEPATVTIFLAAMAGLGLRRRLRARTA